MNIKENNIDDNSGKEFIIGFMAGLICLGTLAVVLLVAIFL